MKGEIKDRVSLKAELVNGIGPWAFQSYNKKYWPEMSDKDIIEGALLHAPEKYKFNLLAVYDLSEIRDIWEKYVVIQANWHKAANLWVAENLFHASNPEQFVNDEFHKSHKRRLRNSIYF